MQVVENLLSNADKYSPEGEAVELEAEAGGADVVIRVLDRGHGVRPADVERVFEPFFRAAATEKVASGSGLGLAVCRRLVELQGGEIRCRPRPGGGSIFEFTLPTTAVDDEA